MTLLELSPIDLFFSGPESRPSTVGFWFEGRLDVVPLRHSLARLAELYFPIRGRLVEASSSVLGLGHFDRWPELEHAEVDDSDLAIDDELLLLGRFEAASNSPEGRLTTFKLFTSERCSALVVSFSHVLGDAAAFFDLLMSWVQLAEGRRVVPPSFDRDVFRRLADSTTSSPHQPSLHGPELARNNHGFIGVGPRRLVPPQDFIGVHRTLYRRAEVELMRAAASRQRERPATLFSTLAGEAWRLKAVENDGAHETVLVCPVDLRRVLPEVPARYFGNAVKGVSVIKRTAEVLSASEAERAEWVRDAVQSVATEQLVVDFHVLDLIRTAHGYERVQSLRASGANSLLVSDMSFAPVRLIRFQGKTSFKISLLSLYSNSAALVAHPEGYELVRAKVIHRGAS